MKYESILRATAARATTYQRVGAVLVRSGSVISTGTTSKGTHPLVQRLAKLVGERRFSVHAEMDAMLHLPLERIEGSVMYVIRVLRSGKLGLAMPCKLCTCAMYVTGVKRATFSVNLDRWETLSIEDLLEIHGLDGDELVQVPLIGQKFGSNTFASVS